MTMREIHFALKRIDVRRHNNYAMQAALFGHKIKTKAAISSPVASPFTDEEEKAADRAMKAALLRSGLRAKAKK